ncbi:MAG: hypothetical protein WCK34_16235, partial [Bacteroidota bacterium]
LAFNPVDGKPYVAFTNSSKATVMKFDGASWVYVGTPNFSAAGAEWISFAFSPAGQPYVSYSDWSTNPTRKITVKKFNGTNWVTVGNTGFSSSSGYPTTLAINPADGQPYVGFTDYDPANYGKITVMRFNSTSWVNVGNAGISAGGGDYASLAFCPSDHQPYIAYKDYSGVQRGATVMKFNGTGWASVGPAQFSPGEAEWLSLAFSASGQPNVAFVDGSDSSKITVMKFDGGNWTHVGIAGFTGPMSYYPGLAFSPSGQLFVVYKENSLAIGDICVKRYDSLCTVGPAGPVTGTTQVCAGGSGYVYTIAPVLNATTYNWSLPAGGTIISGAGTNNITVSFALNAVSGTVTVYGSSSCAGTSSQLPVNVSTLPAPAITGTNTLCVNSGYYHYVTDSGMSGYQWNVSPGGTITSGQGSNVIQVLWNQQGIGWVSVNYMNNGGCMAATPAIFPVEVDSLPGQAGAISGIPVVCAGSENIAYSVAPVSNTLTYVWTLPPGASVVSGGGTNSVIADVAVGAMSGYITVYGNNLCGNGAMSPRFYLTVIPKPVTPVISEDGDTLTSSAPFGNQWYYNYTLLVNDTGRTHILSPALQGNY